MRASVYKCTDIQPLWVRSSEKVNWKALMIAQLRKLPHVYNEFVHNNITVPNNVSVLCFICVQEIENDK